MTPWWFLAGLIALGVVFWGLFLASGFFSSSSLQTPSPSSYFIEVTPFER